MRKVIVGLIILALGLPVVPTFLPQTVYGMTGSGSIGDPYLIYNATDLQNMNLDMYNKHYELANDINATITSTWNGGAGFIPVGNSTTPFEGFFDGNGYTITGLYSSTTSGDYRGLFGVVDGSAVGSTITDVVFYDCYTKGNDYVGTLAGSLQNVDVSYVSAIDCYVRGTYSGDGLDNVGGLIGEVNDSGAISYCSYTGTVRGDGGDDLGGLIGYLYTNDATPVSVYRCTVDATIDCNSAYGWLTSSTGGLAGRIARNSPNPAATIRQCYTEGNITATGVYPNYYSNRVGGMVGWASTSGCVAITDSYSMMDVLTGSAADIGGRWIGGLVGELNGSASRCYAAGLVVGYSSVGGLVGISGSGSNSFWDKETTTQTSSSVGTGKLTSEMKIETTFTDATWDFDDVWGMLAIVNTGYPFLIFNTNYYQAVWFQPNTIIEGTTLPNRATGSYPDGEIHWGSNPAGITFEQGIWTPDTDYEFAPITAEGPDIIQPDPSSMFTDVDTAGLVDNPLYPGVEAIVEASNGQLNARLVWLGGAWLVVIAAMLLTHLGVNRRKKEEAPQHFVLTTIVGLGLSIFFYVIGIFPLWVIILMALGLVGSIIYERQPVL